MNESLGEAYGIVCLGAIVFGVAMACVWAYVLYRLIRYGEGGLGGYLPRPWLSREEKGGELK